MGRSLSFTFVAGVFLVLLEPRVVLGSEQPSPTAGPVQGGDCSRSYGRLVKLANWKNDAVRPWVFSEAWEARLRAISMDSTLSTEEKMSGLYKTLMAAKLANSSKVTRLLMTRLVASVEKNKSLYGQTVGKFVAKIMGPHYHPLVNGIAFNELDPAKKAMVAMHELEHAFHRNENPFIFLASALGRLIENFILNPVSSILINRMESRAIGAQWELAQRIPAEERTALLNRLKGHTSPEIDWDFKGTSLEKEVQKWKLDPETLKSFEAMLEKPASGSSGKKLSRKEVRDKFFSERQQKIEQALKNILIRSLENAHLSKEEFINSLAREQGYALDQLLGAAASHPESRKRAIVLMTSICLVLLNSSSQQEPAQSSESSDKVANDLAFATRYYSVLLADPGSELPK